MIDPDTFPKKIDGATVHYAGTCALRNHTARRTDTGEPVMIAYFAFATTPGGTGALVFSLDADLRPIDSHAYNTLEEAVDDADDFDAIKERKLIRIAEQPGGG